MHRVAVCYSIFGNVKKIIGLTPGTKLAGFASDFYSQSELFANCLQLMKVDGFHLSTFLGSSWYSICDRFRHFGNYINQNCLIDNIWQLKNVFENYTFQLCFDNYLETVKIIICYSYYDKKMIDNIMVLE